MFFEQVVKAYYGGREISDEDLEKALVVGMSPPERKRFEKKRGFTFKHLTGGIDQTHRKENDISIKADAFVQNASKGESMDTDVVETDQKQDYVNMLIVDVTSDINAPEGDISASENLLNEATTLVHVGDISLRQRSKQSLLGHGPHGKQVVEHLLKEYREEGIREFCQRWRQVFVEALHPRFLPAGWDVMHRYARVLCDIINLSRMDCSHFLLLHTLFYVHSFIILAFPELYNLKICHSYLMLFG